MGGGYPPTDGGYPPPPPWPEARSVKGDTPKPVWPYAHGEPIDNPGAQKAGRHRRTPDGFAPRTPDGFALRQALVRLRLIEERVSHVLPADLQQELAASIQGVTDQVRGRGRSGPTGRAQPQSAAVADILAALATALRDAAP